MTPSCFQQMNFSLLRRVAVLPVEILVQGLKGRWKVADGERPGACQRYLITMMIYMYHARVGGALGSLTSFNRGMNCRTFRVAGKLETCFTFNFMRLLDL